MRNIMLAATALVAVVAVAAPASAQMPNQPVITTAFGASAATGAAAEPGTITVRSVVRLWTEANYGTDSGTVSKNASGQPNGSKNSGVYFGSFARWYPGFDGVAANGLKYGVSLQFRQNSGISGSKAGSISGNTLGNTFYVRTTEGYVGTPTAGNLYFGETFGAVAKLAVGTMETFDFNGGFNGDVPGVLSSSVAPNWVFPHGSGNWSYNKLVYISPSYNGFVYGAAFTPNMTSGDTSCTQASAAAPGCGMAASLPGGALSGVNKARNVFDVAVQYKGSFGPVAVATTAGYIMSGRVNDSTATAATVKFKNYGIFDFGAQGTYDGYTLAGHFTTGAVNGNGALIQAGQKNAVAFVGGLQKVMGNVIFGFQYLNELSAGTFQAGRNNMMHETGVVVGGAWDYAPGAVAYASVIYVQRTQANWDFLNAAAGRFNNRVQGRGVQVGNRFAF
jgi:hypothetical protein